MIKLKNKVAVVTGGGSGIGAGICKQFRREGAKVAVCDISKENADKTIDINLKGTFNACQATVRRMKKQGGGVILNMSSQSGKKGNAQYAAYCTSKFAITGLTQSLAAEFAGNNIRINALCPGVVLTPLWDVMIGDYAAKQNMKIEDVKPYLEGEIPLNRLCSIEDIAKTAVFYASDDATYRS